MTLPPCRPTAPSLLLTVFELHSTPAPSCHHTDPLHLANLLLTALELYSTPAPCRPKNSMEIAWSVGQRLTNYERMKRAIICLKQFINISVASIVIQNSLFYTCQSVYQAKCSFCTHLLECGDGLCIGGETCETCAKDCCGLQFPVEATAGIAIFCVLPPVIVIIATLGVCQAVAKGLSQSVHWHVHIISEITSLVVGVDQLLALTIKKILLRAL